MEQQGFTDSSSTAEAIRDRVLATPSTQSRLPVTARVRGRGIGRRGRRIEVTALIEALHGVATATGVDGEIEDALATIVEQAKSVTNTDKAVLTLMEERDGSVRVDSETVVARGARDELPESWWAAHVERMTDEVARTRAIVTFRDRSQGAWLACAPALSRGGPVAVLCAINSGRRAFTRDEVNFLGILGAFAGSVIENARLAEQARHALLVGERDRIAREMHDGLAQSLFSASLGLEVARKSVTKDPPGAVERIRDVQRMITDGMAELRHHIYDLRSPRLERMGLVKALESYLENVDRDASRGTGLTVLGSERSLEDSGEACLYRVAREAVTNAIRHADCSSISVVIEYRAREVELTVVDDGCGFDVRDAFESAGNRGSLGLRNMRDRTNATGGRVDIASSEDGGTRVRVRMPC